MKTASIINTEATEALTGKVDRKIIDAAKAYLLSESNKPKYDPTYGTKFKQLGAADFSAYAILRGRDWRAGINDLKANLQPYTTWKDHILAQYGRAVTRELMSQEDWGMLVESALKAYPAE